MLSTIHHNRYDLHRSTSCPLAVDAVDLDDILADLELANKVYLTQQLEKLIARVLLSNLESILFHRKSFILLGPIKRIR
jgi:hypothetical protein